MNNKKSILVLLSVVLVVTTYCSNNYFGRVLTRNSSIEPDDVTITPIDVPDGADSSKDYVAVEATFTQPTIGQQMVNPDIVFVMDTSGSMVDERTALVNAIGGWLTTLENNGFNNYCVSVMRAAYTGADSGRLVTSGSNPRCLCRDQFSNADIVTKFTQNMNSFNLGGGSEEGGIVSLHNALNDSAKLTANQTDGCFRHDLVLVPLFVADENDMGAVVRPGSESCGGGNNATRSDGTNVLWNTVQWDNTSFPDLDGQYVTAGASNPKYVQNSCDEAQVRLRYYSEATPTGPGGSYRLLVTPKSVADDVLEYNGDLPTYGSAIIYNSTTFPTNSGAESQGWGYSHFASELGFPTANLATANPNTQSAFNTQMNQIADALTTALSAVRVFTLTPGVCEGLEDSLVVKVNSTTLSTPSQYTLSANRKKVTVKTSVNIPTGATMSFDYIGCQ